MNIYWNFLLPSNSPGCHWSCPTSANQRYLNDQLLKLHHPEKPQITPYQTATSNDDNGIHKAHNDARGAKSPSSATVELIAPIPADLYTPLCILNQHSPIRHSFGTSSSRLPPEATRTMGREQGVKSRSSRKVLLANGNGKRNVCGVGAIL